MADPRRSPIHRERLGAAGSLRETPIPRARGVGAAGPLDASELPPPFPRDYPGIDGRANVARDEGLGSRPPYEPSSIEALIRTHKVVDRDTLPALAARYLGSPERADEIYQANRDVLHSPELLPIGVELKILMGRAEAESPSQVGRRRRMAPIRHVQSGGPAT